MEKLFSQKLFFSLILLTSFNQMNYSSRTGGHTTPPTNKPQTKNPVPPANAASLVTFKTYLGAILTTASTQFGSISSSNNNNNNNNNRNNNNRNNNSNLIMQIKTQIDSLNTSLTSLPDINSIIVSVTMTLNTIKTALANSLNQSGNNQNNSLSADMITKINSYITDFILNITSETVIGNLQNYFNGAFNPKVPTAINTKPISVILDYIYNLFIGGGSKSSNLIYPFTPNSSYFLSRSTDLDNVIRSAINKYKNIDAYLNLNDLTNQKKNNDITLIVLHYRYLEFGLNNLFENNLSSHNYSTPEVRAQANLNEIRVALQDLIYKNYQNSNIFFVEFNSEQFGSMDNSDGTGMAAMFGLNDSQDGVDFHPALLIYPNILSKMSNTGATIDLSSIKTFIKARNNAIVLKNSDLLFTANSGSDIYPGVLQKLTTTLSSAGIKTVKLPQNSNSIDLNETIRINNNQQDQYNNLQQNQTQQQSAK